MRHVRALPLFLLAALLQLGCASLNGRSAKGPPIQTDRTVYVVNDSGGLANLTIRMTYTNNTGKPAFLPTCRGPQPPRLQKQVGDTWVVAFAPTVLACEGAPIEVAAGDSYDYTFRILAGMPGTSYAPRWAVSDIPGTYRVLWEIFSDVQGNPARPVTTRDPLPVDQEISNTFKLVR
jgi:hypothetical protein